MPNTNFEENLKSFIGNSVLQNLQLQTVANQLNERLEAIQAELDTLKPKAAEDKPDKE